MNNRKRRASQMIASNYQRPEGELQKMQAILEEDIDMVENRKFEDIQSVNYYCEVLLDYLEIFYKNTLYLRYHTHKRMAVIKRMVRRSKVSGPIMG